MPEPTPHDPIARLLRDLPEETPSMAWRAELNRKLRAEDVRRVRTRRWSLGSFGVGLAAAAFVATVVVPTMIVGPNALAPTPFVAEARADVAVDDLLALDREGTALAEISGAGIAAAESDLTEGEIQDVLASQML